MSLYERLKEYALKSEWSANHNDGTGQHCPHCDVKRSEGKHDKGCPVGQICDDVRLLENSKKAIVDLETDCE